jgi:hypothetical protein
MTTGEQNVPTSLWSLKSAESKYLSKLDKTTTHWTKEVFHVAEASRIIVVVEN